MLQSFQISKLHVPIGRTIGDSMCHYDAFRVAALRLETSAGLVGWGFGEKAYGGHFAKEAAWNRPLPGVAALRAEFTERFAPWLLGKTALGVKLGTPAPVLAGDDALALATRMALWDLIGKEAGLPLYRLLGGENARASLPAYASACEFQQPDDFLREFYGAKVREGFRMFKIKIGHPDPQHDLRRLLVMRDVIGPEASLAADANKAWSARETVDRLNFFNAGGVNLAYIEDPLDPEDVEGYRHLAGHSPVPVVGHDYIREPARLRPLLETGALAMLRARDGLDYALGLLPLAREFNRPVIGCNTLFEWNIHAALAFPEFDRIEFSDQQWNQLPLTPVRIDNGRMFPPRGPGHGFDPNPDVFESWTIND
jgi:L-alanine-DL-glutamate epimerase-like enolase superfamily enzyme